MTVQRQIVFWAMAFAILMMAVFLLGSTMLPFVAGLVLAYLLDPLADRLEHIGLSRLGATALILLTFIILFILALIVLVPLIAHQLVNFVSVLPSYISKLQALLVENGGPLLERLGGADALNSIQSSLSNVLGQGAAWAGKFLQSLWSGGQAIISVISLIVVTPIVAFYLLADWDHLVATVDGWIPLRHRATVRMLCADIDRAIAGCIRGQALVCFILGTFYALGLSFVGLNFGATIGMLAGLLSFIPYVGATIGLVLAIGVAIVQFWPDWTMILATAAVFGVGQFMEGNFLSPRIVGQSAGLHPVWLMFALLSFGSLFGFVGLLIAVPLAAAIGVLARFALRQYLASPIYLGGLKNTVEDDPEGSDAG